MLITSDFSQFFIASMPTAAATPVAPQAPMGIQRPAQPESTVKPVEISIPDFLKNSKR